MGKKSQKENTNTGDSRSIAEPFIQKPLSTFVLTQPSAALTRPRKCHPGLATTSVKLGNSALCCLTSGAGRIDTIHYANDTYKTKKRNMRPRLLMVIGDMGAACLRTVIREPSCHTPECEYRMVGSLEEKRYGVNWSSIKRSSIFAPVDDFSIQRSSFTRRLTTPHLPTPCTIAHFMRGTLCRRVLWVLMSTRTTRSVGRPITINLLNSREAVRRLIVLC